MKKTAIVFILLVLSISLFGCGSETPPQSTFKDDFTIGTIVEENSKLLISGPRQLSGSEYGSSEQPFTQKQEEITFQIESTELSDFFTAIQAGIDESITSSGASIVGHGTGGITDTSFSVQYLQDQSYGTIYVWGVRGEGTNYFLIMIITES
jgi:hypothetical protein